MLIYLNDPCKKTGYMYNKETRLYEEMNKPKYLKLGSPEYYFEDISNKIDTRRDCIPLGHDVVFPNGAKERDDSYYFTWSLPQPSLHSTSKPIPNFIVLLSEMMNTDKIVRVECDPSHAEILINKLECLSPLFYNADLKLFKKFSISNSTFQKLQKFWILLFLNYDNVTPRRPYRNKTDQQLNSPMIIFTMKNSDIVLKREEVISVLSLGNDELLKMLFPYLNVVCVQS